MADTQEKPSSGTEQPDNSVEATSSTQDERSHGGCVQVGDAEDKDAKVPNGHSSRCENMIASTTGGQQRSETRRAPDTYPLARWLGEGPREGYWNSQTRGS